MNKTVAEARQLVEEMAGELAAVAGVEKVLCPPYTALGLLAEMLEGTGIGLGAQNLYWEPSGAYTGEIAPAMVAMDAPTASRSRPVWPGWTTGMNESNSCG